MVDVSLVESVFNVMESLVPEYDLLGEVRTRTGGALPGITPSNTYPTRDGGYVVIAGNSDPIFRRLMTAIGRPDLAEDPALRNNDGRSQAIRLAGRHHRGLVAAPRPSRRRSRSSTPRTCRPAGSTRWPTSWPTRITRPAT